MSAAFSEVMPKYSPAGAAPTPAPGAASSDLNRATVIRLPEYIVREPAVPRREDVTTDYIKSREAVHHYFGEEESLYRILNGVTLAGLWAKIPVLGKYPFIAGQFHGTGSGGAAGPTTTEKRAGDIYKAEKFADDWTNLTNLEAGPKSVETNK